MDIQKELESFKTVAIAKGWSIDGETTQTNYRFYSLTTASGWEAWQAAKAQAVPEGFVLVPKEPSAELVNYGHQVFLGHFNEGGRTGGRSLYFAYKAMIEAQEQKG